jgi:hypothetical protein
MEIFVIGLYLLPALIAIGRSHANTTALLIINLFLGWTVLVWIICLAWAFSAQPKKAEN